MAATYKVVTSFFSSVKCILWKPYMIGFSSVSYQAYESWHWRDLNIRWGFCLFKDGQADTKTGYCNPRQLGLIKKRRSYHMAKPSGNQKYQSSSRWLYNTVELLTRCDKNTYTFKIWPVTLAEPKTLLAMAQEHKIWALHNKAKALNNKAKALNNFFTSVSR